MLTNWVVVQAPIKQNDTATAKLHGKRVLQTLCLERMRSRRGALDFLKKSISAAQDDVVLARCHATQALVPHQPVAHERVAIHAHVFTRCKAEVALGGC